MSLSVVANPDNFIMGTRLPSIEDIFKLPTQDTPSSHWYHQGGDPGA